MPDTLGVRVLPESVRTPVGPQQEHEALPQRRVPGASLVEEGGPFGRVGDLQGGGQDVAFAHDGLPGQGYYAGKKENHG